MLIVLVKSIFMAYLIIGVLISVIAVVSILLGFTHEKPDNLVVFFLMSVFLWGYVLTSRYLYDAWIDYKKNKEEGQ